MSKNIEKTTKTVQTYPESFRRKVVEEYIAGDCTYRGLLRKYGIKSNGAIATWMQLYGYVNVKNEVLRKPKFESITYSCMQSKNSSNTNEDPQALQKRIAELERQLQDEKLRCEAYQRMIEKTEKDLNISIRKKPFTR